MTQPQARVSDDDALTSDRIADYLRRHPAFFDAHPQLLETLRVPHPSGEAVSLVARQLELLREKNRALQEQLESLVRIARDNDELSDKTHRLVLSLMDAGGFDDACDRLQRRVCELFSVDQVGIRIVAEEGETPDESWIVAPDDPRLQRFEKILRSGKPRCGRLDTDRSRFVFAGQAEAVGSCAVIPLAAFEAGGLLAIGSRDSDRFHPGMGHLFLGRLGEIVGSCLARLRMINH